MKQRDYKFRVVDVDESFIVVGTFQGGPEIWRYGVFDSIDEAYEAWNEHIAANPNLGMELIGVYALQLPKRSPQAMLSTFLPA